MELGARVLREVDGVRLTSQFDDQVSIDFPHPIEQVWRCVAGLERIGEWSPECFEITWIPPATCPGPGVQFVGRNRMGPMRWRTTCTIVAWEPPVRLAYDARHVSGAVTRWTFELASDIDGTLVTEGYQTMGSPKLVMLADRVAGRPMRLRHGMEATLKAMCAATSSTG